MMNSDFEQTLVSTLPDDLIFNNILPRLPVKTLLRFKTVCKLWLSIISSACFAKSHLKFSSVFPLFVVLARDYGYPKQFKLFLLHYDEINNVKDPVILDMDPDWEFPLTKFMASCNGLLCFYLRGDPDYFVVWNPATRQCRKIMTPCDEDYIGDHSRDFGFSYASSIDDYKIVSEICGTGAIFYFSLRSDQWKRTDIDDRGCSNNSINHSRFYVSHAEHREEGRCIVGFDVVDEKLKEFPLMDWLSRYDMGHFFAIQENVSIYCHAEEENVSDVWVLKEYSDCNSWEKLFSFNCKTNYFWSMTETGKCLHQSGNQLKVIDPGEGVPDETRVGTRVSYEICHPAVYVESLISPFVFPSLER